MNDMHFSATMISILIPIFVISSIVYGIIAVRNILKARKAIKDKWDKDN